MAGENAADNFVLMGISTIQQDVVYYVPPTQATFPKGRDAAVRVQKALENTPPPPARYVRTLETI